MPCKHSLIGTPDRCSQCLEAPVKRVDVVTDAYERTLAERRLEYARRGGRARRISRSR
jgi:hypothetical protein